jgi:5-methyltetrahydrofolate--homocysteine methyltransferase
LIKSSKKNFLQQKELLVYSRQILLGVDDIEIYTDESRSGVKRVLHTLRQQMQKSKDEPNIALADFIAPKETGVEDYIGMFAVTAGIGIEKLVATI